MIELSNYVIIKAYEFMNSKQRKMNYHIEHLLASSAPINRDSSKFAVLGLLIGMSSPKNFLTTSKVGVWRSW